MKAIEAAAARLLGDTSDAAWPKGGAHPFAGDVRLLATLVRDLHELVTPKVREAATESECENDTERLVMFALAVLERLEGRKQYKRYRFAKEPQ